jgi:hypothetical protein
MIKFHPSQTTQEPRVEIKFHPEQPQGLQAKIVTTDENIKRINQKISERLGLSDRAPTANTERDHVEPKNSTKFKQ